MKRRIVSLLLVIMILAVSVFSAGCDDSTDEIVIENNKETVLKEGEYQIYYLNKDMTTLKSKVIEYDKDKSVEDMAEVFMSYINKYIVEETKDITTSATLLNVNISNGILTLDFDKTYIESQGITEILLRACIVLTMTQIEGVDYVGITVNGQTIKDEAGNTINKMKADDFVNFKDSFPYAKKEVTVVLYFSNEDGTKLKKKEIVCYYDYSISYEEFIIMKLIEGVTQDDIENGYRSTLPKETILDMVYTRDGVCYVDIDQSIMETIRPVSTELLIYSIVNSLSELSYVTKVQFSVEGESDIKLYSEYDIKGQFSRNLDIIIKEGEEN